MFSQRVKNLVYQTRFSRKWHHTISIIAVTGLFCLAFTGLLLGWKKPLQLLPPTAQVSRSTPWLPIDSMVVLAAAHMKQRFGQEEYVVDRIDIRPEAGVAKVTFTGLFWEVQLDGSTGKVVSAKKRTSDLIEKIHDGSILDFLVNPGSQIFKLVYISIIGLSLLLLCITGLNLWINPHLIRRLKKDVKDV